MSMFLKLRRCPGISLLGEWADSPTSQKLAPSPYLEKFALVDSPLLNFYFLSPMVDSSLTKSQFSPYNPTHFLAVVAAPAQFLF